MNNIETREIINSGILVDAFNFKWRKDKQDDYRQLIESIKHDAELQSDCLGYTVTDRDVAIERAQLALEHGNLSDAAKFIGIAADLEDVTP